VVVALALLAAAGCESEWVASGNHGPDDPPTSERAQRVHVTISADGHVVAWREGGDLFVRDLSGVAELVSVDSAESPGNGVSGNPALSSDSRFVSFDSMATDLVPGDTNGKSDVFLRDRLLGTTTLVNVDPTGTLFPSGVGNHDISGTGRYLLLGSLGQTLWVHDRQTGTTTPVKPPETIPHTGGPTVEAALSANGRYVAFNSRENLVPGASGTEFKVYRHDRIEGATELVSVRLDGGTGTGLKPTISRDGRHVAFVSLDNGLVADDAGNIDAFRRDMDTGTTRRVPLDPPSDVELGSEVTIAENGRYLTFNTTDGTLFHYDFSGGDLSTIDSVETYERSGAANSAISADGRYVVYVVHDVDIDGVVDSQLFVEVAPTIDITGGTPISVARGSSAQVTISGSNLDEVVELLASADSGVTFSNVVATETEVHAIVSATSAATLGLQTLNLRVSTPGPSLDGESFNTKKCVQCLRVIDA
jgi:Tol biopolymer transport system component